MVYKRYIKRGGKVFGPYYYESHRDKDGKVVSKYVEPVKKLKKNNFLINLFFILALLFLVIITLQVYYSLSDLGSGSTIFDKPFYGFLGPLYESFSKLVGFAISDDAENPYGLEVTEENETEQENELVIPITSEESQILKTNLTSIITTKQYRVVLGKPVKHIKKINTIETNNFSIEISKLAENITVKTGDEVASSEREIDEYNYVIESENNNIKKSLITGQVSLEIKHEKGILTRFWDWLKQLTISGKVIQESEFENNIIETDDSKIVDVSEIAEDVGYGQEQEIAVEYYTPGPTANETNTLNGKMIIISAPDELNYTNILAYTELDNRISVNESKKVKLYWHNNGTRELVNFDSYDLDEDNLIDYVEWNIPHLSEQVYEIIYITNAVELDSNKIFIRDVYDYVKEQDDNWTLISDENYLRVTFEKNLTNTKDITLYARGEGNVEVYEENLDEIISVFNISGENTYKNYLVNLVGEQDVFDLRFLGNIEVDYIVDPFVDNGSIAQTLYDCGKLNTTNAVYTMNQSVTTTGTCFNVTAENVTLDCGSWENSITYGNQDSALHYFGIYSNKNRTHIINCQISSGALADQWDTRRGIYFEDSSFGSIFNVNSSHNRKQGIYLIGSQFNEVNNIIINENYEGLWISNNASYNNFTNIISKNNAYGAYLAGGSGSAIGNFFDNLTLFNNTYGGFFISSGYMGVKITNSNISENREDISLSLWWGTVDCILNLTNVSSSGNRFIEFYNHSINLENQEFSQLILCGAHYSNLTNVTILGSDTQKNNALYLYYTNNSVISELNSSENYNGVYFGESNNNTVINGIFDSNSDNFLGYPNNKYNQWINNSFKSGTLNIILSEKNYFYNNTLFNSSLIFHSAGGNLFSGGIINESPSNGIYFTAEMFGPASDNVIQDTVIINSGTYDVLAEYASINNTLVNVTYNASKESIDSTSELIRKWYYRAYVNDSNGNLVANANVTAFNVSGSYQFNLTTDGTGYTETVPIIEYINDGTLKMYYSNYTIYVDNETLSTNKTINVTDNIYKDVFTFSVAGSSDTEISDCGLLSTPDTEYTQTADIIALVTPCINITANNVTFNGNNFNITNSSLNGGIGFYINSSNVTLLNVNAIMKKASSTSIGLVLNKAKNTYIENSSFDFNYYGIYIYANTNYSTFYNVTANNNSQQGIYSSGNHVNISNLNANSNYDGIEAQSSSYYNIENSTFNYNTGYGVEFNSVNDVLVKNITSNNNTLSGINFGVGSRNTVQDSFFHGNKNHGIYSSGGTTYYLRIINNLVNRSTYEGIYIVQSKNNIIFNNTVINNQRYGIYTDYNVNNLSVINNTFAENKDFDFFPVAYLAGSTNSFCTNITWVNNTGSGNREIKFFNSTVNLENQEYSELVLCNAPYSTLTNISVAGSESLSNNMILIMNSSYSNFTNVSSNENYQGIYTLLSNNLDFNNINSSYNTNNGLYFETANFINLNNSFVFGNNHTQAQIYFATSGTNSTFENNIISKADYSGIYLVAGTNNSFINNTFYANKWFDLFLYSSNNYIANNNFSSTGKSRGNIISNKANNTVINNYFYNTSVAGYGVEIAWGGGDIYLNNTFVSCVSGINFGGNNIVISGNNFYGGQSGFYQSGFGYVNTTISNNILLNTTGSAIYLAIAYNSTVENNTIINATRALYYDIRGANIITRNNYIENCSLISTVGCIHLESITFSNFTNNTLNGSKGYLYYLTASSNNNFEDSISLNSITNDVYLISNSQNNTFLNVSYNPSKEYVASGSSLTRKWYYQAYVNDTEGNSVPNANVTAHNVSGIYNFNLTTNASGITEITEITEYRNNGTLKTYHTSYTIYADNVTLSTNKTLNFTTNVNDVITLGFDSPPRVTINSPTAATYTVYAYLVNISINKLGYCEFSLDNGITNETLSTNNNLYFNATKTSVANGNYVLYAYCNDSLGNRNDFENVSFTIAVSTSSPCGDGTCDSSGGETCSSCASDCGACDDGGGGGGGGSGCTSTSWDCAWTECIDNIRTQTCTSNCGTTATNTSVCACIPKWDCDNDDWTACIYNQTSRQYYRTRNCKDLNSCNSSISTYALCDSENCTINLNQGWNQKSLCRKPDNKNVINVLGDSYKDVDYILEWDSVNQKFNVYSKQSSVSPLTKVNFKEDRSYFFYLTRGASTLNYSGTLYSELDISINSPFWESPSYVLINKSGININQGEFNNAKISYMLRWNSLNQKFDVYSVLSDKTSLLFYPSDGIFMISKTGEVIRYRN